MDTSSLCASFVAGAYGAYLIVAACVPLKSARRMIGRYKWWDEPLNTRKARISTFLDGLIFLVLAVAIAIIVNPRREIWHF